MIHPQCGGGSHYYFQLRFYASEKHVYIGDNIWLAFSAIYLEIKFIIWLSFSFTLTRLSTQNICYIIIFYWETIAIFTYLSILRCKKPVCKFNPKFSSQKTNNFYEMDINIHSLIIVLYILLYTYSR